MRLIERPTYLDQLKNWRDKHLIKVITGVRRCGKSTLMAMFQRHLVDSGVSPSDIVAINFEDYDFLELRKPKALHEFVKARLSDGRQNYIFFDEIQLVEDFQTVVDSLHIKEGVDIYMTGSNAGLLSSELATLLSGRYVEIKMTPLSFKEYVEGSGGGSSLAEKYYAYTSTSSFPYSLELSDGGGMLDDYLGGLYSSILLKDIMQRNRISDTMMLEAVIRFAADNIGNTMSTKSIADTMTSNGRKIDVKTVEKYLSAMVESFILYKVKRYDLRGKSLLKSMEKYYLVDVGLRRMLLGTKGFDVGRILENVVYLELQRRYDSVCIGKAGELEIDFVAQSTNETCYFQVAATVRDEKTLSRELASLKCLNDHYPKVLLTLDEDPEGDYDGIRRVNALRWLMG